MGIIQSCEPYVLRDVASCSDLNIPSLKASCVSNYDELFCVVNDANPPDEVKLCASEELGFGSESLFYQTIPVRSTINLSCEDEKNFKACPPLFRLDEITLIALSWGNACPYFSLPLGETMSFEGIRFREGGLNSFAASDPNGVGDYLFTPAVDNIIAYDYTCGANSITGTLDSDFDNEGKGVGKKFTKAGDDPCDTVSRRRSLLVSIPDSEEVNHMFDLCDLDKDDMITKDEATVCMEHLHEQDSTDSKSTEDISNEVSIKIHKMFAHCDVNSDESVSKYEALVCVPRAHTAINTM